MKNTKYSIYRERTITLYKDGYSGEEIAKMFGMPSGIVYYYLKQAGVPIRPRQTKIERNMEMAQDYKDGLSTPQLAEKYGITQGRAWQVLSLEMDLKLRDKSESIRTSEHVIQRTTDANKRAELVLALYNSGKTVVEICEKTGFSDLVVYKYLRRLDYHPRDLRLPIADFWLSDSPEKYYVLGYLFADGNVSQDGAVTASSKDIEHLREMVSISGGKFTVYRGMGQASFGGVLLGEYLGDYGLIPRKSRIMLFPTNIPDQFLPDFIRGYFDGDGYVGKYKRDPKGTRYSFGFGSGSLAFLEVLHDILLGFGIDNGHIRDQKTEWGQVYQLVYSGANRSRNMRDLLYYDGCFCLERKRAKFAEGPLWVQNY